MASYRAVNLALLLLCVSTAAAVSVTPETQQLANPQEQTYQFIYSVLNNDPQPRTLSLKLDDFSEYLSDRVSLSKAQFSLLPGEAQNVQISVSPYGLGPETHTLKIGVYDGSEKLATLQLLIIVAGTPVEEYAVSIDAKDTTTENAVPVSVSVSNKGNIIGYARLELSIKENGQDIGSVSYPAVVQVLPGKTVSYDLVYTDSLKPEFYTAELSAAFPSKTVTAQDQFTVRLGNTKQRLEVGNDYILTFASVGNPPAVTYSLTDERGAVQAEGTFLPQTGDMIIPTSTLSAGTYDLLMRLPHGEQHITLIVTPERHYGRIAVIFAVLAILGYAAYSTRKEIALRYRLWKLTQAIARREAIVNNLINRSHKLVDAIYERRREASGGARTPPQGT